jgi:hypothetical protein
VLVNRKEEIGRKRREEISETRGDRGDEKRDEKRGTNYKKFKFRGSLRQSSS